MIPKGRERANHEEDADEDDGVNATQGEGKTQADQRENEQPDIHFTRAWQPVAPPAPECPQESEHLPLS